MLTLFLMLILVVTGYFYRKNHFIHQEEIGRTQVDNKTSITYKLTYSSGKFKYKNKILSN